MLRLVLEYALVQVQGRQRCLFADLHVVSPVPKALPAFAVECQYQLTLMPGQVPCGRY